MNTGNQSLFSGTAQVQGSAHMQSAELGSYVLKATSWILYALNLLSINTTSTLFAAILLHWYYAITRFPSY